jgi:hypothetical protein
MPKRHHAPQVGAPDPELRTSPILDRNEEEGSELSLDSELESGACYFNDHRYAIGDYVHSGHELLHCEEHGVWIKVTEER